LHQSEHGPLFRKYAAPIISATGPITALAFATSAV
jgi:hypothetical protein